MIVYLITALTVLLVQASHREKNSYPALVKHCRHGNLLGIEQLWCKMNLESRGSHVLVCLEKSAAKGHFSVFEWILSQPEAQHINALFLRTLKIGKSTDKGAFGFAIDRHLNTKEAFLSNCKHDRHTEVYKDLSYFKFDSNYLVEGLHLALHHGSYRSAACIVSSPLANHVPVELLEQALLQACYGYNPGLVSMLLQHSTVHPTAHSNSALCLDVDSGHDLIIATLLKDSRIDPRFNDNYLFEHLLGYSNCDSVLLLMGDHRFVSTETAIITSLKANNLDTSRALICHPKVSLQFLIAVMDEAPDSVKQLIKAIHQIRTFQELDITALQIQNQFPVLMAAVMNGNAATVTKLIEFTEFRWEGIHHIYCMAEKMQQMEVLSALMKGHKYVREINLNIVSISTRAIELSLWKSYNSLKLLLFNICSLDNQVSFYLKELENERNVNQNVDLLERHIRRQYDNLNGIQCLVRNTSALFFAMVYFKSVLTMDLIGLIDVEVRKSFH